MTKPWRSSTAVGPGWVDPTPARPCSTPHRRPAVVFNTITSMVGVFNTMANRKRPKYLGLWVTERGLADIDQRAIEAGLLHNGEPNRSEMARQMLAYAAQHMPRKRAPK